MSTLHKRSLDAYGNQAIMHKVAEEISEFLAAFNKVMYLRSIGERHDKEMDHLCEEWADMQYVIGYLHLLFPDAYRSVSRWSNKKRERMEMQLKKTETKDS